MPISWTAAWTGSIPTSTTGLSGCPPPKDSFRPATWRRYTPTASRSKRTWPCSRQRIGSLTWTVPIRGHPLSTRARKCHLLTSRWANSCPTCRSIPPRWQDGCRGGRGRSFTSGRSTRSVSPCQATTTRWQDTCPNISWATSPWRKTSFSNRWTCSWNSLSTTFSMKITSRYSRAPCLASTSSCSSVSPRSSGKTRKSP